MIIREAAAALLELDEDEFEDALAGMDTATREAVSRCWQLHRLPHQVRPANCNPIWLLMMGRGSGKTRTAAEETLDRCEDWGPAMRGVLISKTIGDVRDVMIEGESGLLACARRRGYSCKYIANRSLVEHPAGGVLHTMSAESIDESRGYQSNFVWWDEIAACRYAIQILDNLMPGWRLLVPNGAAPEMILTTTPRPSPIMHRLVTEDAWRELVTITRGTTHDNARNLNAVTVALLDSVYKGTRLGQQELLGELLSGLGAIFDADVIHRHRVEYAPELDRRIVSLDPSITSKEDSDDAGIIVLGAANSHAYVLDDRTVSQATWSAWGRATVAAALEHDADTIVAEINQGGEGIEDQIRTSLVEVGMSEDAIPVSTVWASKSKKARAEPIGSLYERGRIHHVGHFPALERELAGWGPGMASPNRLDALVHGATHLLLGAKAVPGLDAYLT